MIFIGFTLLSHTMIRYPFNEKGTSSNHCGVDIIYVLTSITTRITRKFTTIVTFIIQKRYDDFELHRNVQSVKSIVPTLSNVSSAVTRMGL